MAEEKNLWKQLKNNTKSIIWTRIEATSGLGIPDLFGFYRRGFWLELKIIKNNKLNFSLHIKLRGFTGIILKVALCSYLPRTPRRGLKYSQSIVRDPTSIDDKPVLCSIVPDPELRSWDLSDAHAGSWTPDGR